MSFYGLKGNAEESLFNKYVLAWYFINTIFSTVGFGDIKAESQAERIFMVWMDGLMTDRWICVCIYCKCKCI